MRNVRIADRRDWVFEAQVPPSKPRRRIWDWFATGVMAIALVGLVVPNEQTLAGTPPPVSTLVSTWSESGTVRTYQESSARFSYRGPWTIARHPRYMGSKARSSRDALARATFQFSGDGVAWIGPVGPTRGKAKVYIDGKYAKTVDTYSSVFRPTRVLFKATFGSVRAGRLTIVVMGTKGHATVAIDAIVVRTVRDQPLVQPTTQPAPATPTPDPCSRPPPRRGRPHRQAHPSPTAYSRTLGWSAARARWLR